jgi:hypothetical protein
MAKERTEVISARAPSPQTIEAMVGPKPEPEPEEKQEAEKIDVEAILTKVRTEMEAQFKNEINGLNRKITELQTVAKTKDEQKKTVEDRLRDLEEQNNSKQRELEHEKLIRQLQAEAASRGLKLEDEIDVDNPNLTLEKAVEFLDKRQAIYAERDKRIANDVVAGNSPKPGSGIQNGRPVDLKKLSTAELMKLEMEGKLNELITR